MTDSGKAGASRDSYSHDSEDHHRRDAARLKSG